MTEYDPTYDYHADPIAILYIRSELRLVVDLQNNIKAQQSEAYARKVRLSNLQEMARTVVYIQEQGIGSREELRARQEEASVKVHTAEASLQDTMEHSKPATRKNTAQSMKKNWICTMMPSVTSKRMQAAPFHP